MTASTGTFAYWRYGQLPPELEVSTAELSAGVTLEGSVSGAGELVPSIAAGGFALTGTLDGVGAVGDLLTAGSVQLDGTLDGQGALVVTLAIGQILGRTPSVSMRYGAMSDFTAPRSGHTGTMSYWRYGAPADFRAQAGPLAPTSQPSARMGPRRLTLTLRLGLGL